MGKKSRREKPGAASGAAAKAASQARCRRGAAELRQNGIRRSPSAAEGTVARAQRAALAAQIDDECKDSVCPGTFRWKPGSASCSCRTTTPRRAELAHGAARRDPPPTILLGWASYLRARGGDDAFVARARGPVVDGLSFAATVAFAASLLDLLPCGRVACGRAGPGRGAGGASALDFLGGGGGGGPGHGEGAGAARAARRRRRRSRPRGRARSGVVLMSAARKAEQHCCATPTTGTSSRARSAGTARASCCGSSATRWSPRARSARPDDGRPRPPRPPTWTPRARGSAPPLAARLAVRYHRGSALRCCATSRASRAVERRRAASTRSTAVSATSSRAAATSPCGRGSRTSSRSPTTSA